MLLIRGGRVLDPASRVDEIADLLIEDGLVSALSPRLGSYPEGAPVVEAHGMIVCPGFVDLHTHLRFPGFPDKETLASGTAAAAAGGFTTVCAMANTDPVVDRPEVLELVLEAASREAVVRVKQLAAVTRGLAGTRATDMAALAEAGAVAFSDDGKPVWDTRLMRGALVEARRLGKVISVHEEEPELVRSGVANAGERARRLGLPEWPCRGEASLVARDLALLEEVGGRLHIAHVSCSETAGLIREAKHRGLAVTAEVTPHHLRLTDRLLDGDERLRLPAAHPCTKVNPPLRSEEDVETMVAALADGAVDAVATDHAPHSEADKTGPFTSAAFGFSAIETALPLLLDLVRAGSIELATLVSRLTAGPARVFGLAAGTLAPGAPADICVFDPTRTWTVTPDALMSKGKNTPLLGARLQGRVTCTIVGGVVVYRWTDDHPTLVS